MIPAIANDVHENNIFKNDEDSNDSVLNLSELVPLKKPIIHVNYHHS